MKQLREDMINMMPVPKRSKTYLSNDDVMQEEDEGSIHSEKISREVDSKEEDDEEEYYDSFHTETDGE